MLKTMTRVLAVAALGLAALGGPIPVAHAEGSTGCIGWSRTSSACSRGEVTVTISVDGKEALLTITSDGEVTCKDITTGKVVPCRSELYGWWSANRGCYVKEAEPQPPTSDPIWAGRTDGAIYQCQRPMGGAAFDETIFWAEEPPPNPEQVLALVGQVTQSMNFKAISMGMAPTPTSLNPDSIGIVGMPVWLWVASPSPQTWGPATATGSSDGLTVTVTAKAERVTWNLGDGRTPIVCGPGSPYDPSYGKVESPTCGSPGYTRQGTYPISAVTHWRIDYTSNVGVSGALAMDLTADAELTVGELQVTSG